MVTMLYGYNVILLQYKSVKATGNKILGWFVKLFWFK